VRGFLLWRWEIKFLENFFEFVVILSYVYKKFKT
jgi:hypothetical protein